MKIFLMILMMASLTIFIAVVMEGRGANAAQQHLIGEVTAIDQATGQFTVKTVAGASITIMTDERTAYRRVPPGQPSLEKAEDIARADIRVGDRVLVPNGAGGAQQASAQQIIVMAREAVASQPERERENWRTRGRTGRVVALDPVKRVMTVELRSRGAAETITVGVTGNVRFRRYAPDSLRPAHATPGTFTDIHVGDQVRILGDLDATGTRLTAEEIVSGSITRLTGVISEIDATRGVVTIKDEPTKQTFTVALGKNTMLRRIPAEFAETLSQRGEQRREAAGEAAGNQAGERRSSPSGQRTENRQGGTGSEGGDRQGRGAGGGNRRGILENLPTITAADLQKGDGVIVTGTKGTDVSRITAMSLVTGDAAMLQRLRRFQGGTNQGNMSPGLPGGLIGGNTDDGEP